MIAKQNITVYSKYIDSVKRLEVWTRNVIKGVSYQDSKNFIGNTDEKNNTVIYVPHTSLMNMLVYTDANGFTGLPGTISLAAGNYIVKGEVIDDITSAKQLETKYPEAVKIVRVDNIDYALNPKLNHFMLGCE